MPERKPSYYAILTANVRYDDRLKDKAKLLYAEITALSESCGYCFASNAYFAKLYKVSNETVSRIISQLAEYNYIDVVIDKKNGNQRKIYIATYPQKHQDLLTKTSIPIDENVNTPIDENVKHNNTSNNTILNTKNNGGSENSSPTLRLAIDEPETYSINSQKSERGVKERKKSSAKRKKEKYAADFDPNNPNHEPYREFVDWVHAECPDVTKIGEPPSVSKFAEYRKTYDLRHMQEVIYGMDNSKNFEEKGKSWGKTMLNWLRRGYCKPNDTQGKNVFKVDRGRYL